MNNQPEPLTVTLSLDQWNLILMQLGEGSINRFLSLLQEMQKQLQNQVDVSVPLESGNG